MLHCKADYCNSNPAGSTEKDWLSTGFDQFHNIAVQTDRSHSHDNEEFRQFFQWSKYIRTYPKAHAYSCNDSRNDKVQDEHWKCSFKLNLPDSLPSFAADFARTSESTSVIGMMASVRVSLTVTAVLSVSLPRFHMLSQVEAAAVTDEVSLIAVPAKTPKAFPLVVSKPSAFQAPGKVQQR